MENKSNFSAYKGLFLALMSGFFYSVAAVIVKQMKNIHPGQLSLYRILAITLFAFPEAVKSKENLLGPKELRFLLIARNILTATCCFLNFIAFRYLPLGESAVITLSFPVFVTIAAKIFLKESYGIFQFFTVISTVVGIVFIVKIPQKLAGSSIEYTQESIYGFSTAVTSLFLSTIVVIVSRKVKTVNSSIVLFSYGWIALLETAILTAIFGTFQLHHCGLQSLYIILLGLLSYGNQTLFLMSLKYEMAGPVSTMRSASDIAFAFMWQTMLFHDIPDIYSLIGAVLVGVSVIFIGLTKWVHSLNEDSLYRKKFIWMIK